ncbi:MAG: hypothetical protein KBA30_05270 [Clostridia bacterium]|nr:hypothetical protein [Clostridia bacterium]
MQSPQSLCDTAGWSDILSIACGPEYVVGLRSDGTVLARGTEVMEEAGLACLKVTAWTDIVAITAGQSQDGRYSWTAGLRSDGTVAITGHDPSGKHFPEIGAWSGIKAITVAEGRLFGLRGDGTVAASGGEHFESAGWTGVTALAGSDDLLVGLREDGTVLVCGTGLDDPMTTAIADWSGIRSVAAGPGIVAGVREDGTLVGVHQSTSRDAAMDRRRFAARVQEMIEEAFSAPGATPTPIPFRMPDYEFGSTPVSIGKVAPEAYRTFSFSMQEIGFDQGRSLSVRAVDENMNLVVAISYTRDGVILQEKGTEIGILDSGSMKYTKVEHTDPDTSAEILAVDTDRIVWRQSDDPARIHLYERRTGEDFAIQPDAAARIIKNAVLAEGALYLSTLTGSGLELAVDRIDIESLARLRLADSASGLFLYGNQAVWTVRNSGSDQLDLYRDSAEGPVLVAESVGDPEGQSGYVGHDSYYQPDGDPIWSVDGSVPRPIIMGTGSVQDAFYSIRDGIPIRVIGKGSETVCSIRYKLLGRYLAFNVDLYTDAWIESCYIYDSENSMLLEVVPTVAKPDASYMIRSAGNKVCFQDAGPDRLDPANVQTLHIVDLEKLG